MEYQKMINFLDNTPNQPPKFRTKYWIEKMINQKECVIPIVALDLRPQC